MSIDPAILREATIGDNSGQVPEDFRIIVTPAEDIPPYLNRQYRDIKTRYEQLMAAGATLPEKIDNDADSGKVGDLVKEMRLWDSKADGARKIEKEPFQKGGATVDAFFKTMADEMEKLKKRALAVQTDYLNAKKERERRRLEEEARKRRDEEQRLAREAAEKQERQQFAEEAKGQAEAAAQEARDNKDGMEQERLDCETALAQAKLRKANARRDRDEAGFNAAGEEVIRAQAALAEAKERLRGAREAQRLALAEAEKKAREARQATTASGNATDAAARATAGAEKIERTLEKATDGDLVRGRSEHGAVNTLSRRWVYDVRDRQAVNSSLSEFLAGFIDPGAIDAAIQKRMMAGNRDVPGVHYEQVSEARAI